MGVRGYSKKTTYEYHSIGVPYFDYTKLRLFSRLQSLRIFKSVMSTDMRDKDQSAFGHPTSSKSSPIEHVEKAETITINEIMSLIHARRIRKAVRKT